VNAQKLGRNISASGKALVQNNRNATRDAAMAFKGAALDTARKDSGGDLRLSRWGKNGVKLNVGFDLEGSPGEQRATVQPRPMGPWKVLEYGAKPHPIIPGLTRRQQRAMALFGFMSGGRGGFDVSALAATARGNRNNRGGSRRRKRRSPLRINGQLRAWANHPGTRGKRTWSRATVKGADDAVKNYRTNQAKALAKAFGR
jgi:hypothetical protein